MSNTEHRSKRRSRMPVRCALLCLAFLMSVLVVSPALAADAIVERLDATSGGQLDVQAAGASVKVEGSSGSGAEVRIRRGDDSRSEIEEDYRISIEENGGDVSVVVEARDKKFWEWGWGRRKALEIEVDVPTRYDARLASSGGSLWIGELDGTVVGKTSGGSVRIGRVTGPTLVKTSGGSVTIEESLGEVEARTSGGSIKIRRAGGPVLARTSGGSITVDEVAGAIDAQTSGGSIRATLTEQPGADCDLSTSGGSVSVRLAPFVAVDIDASSSGGRVTNDLDVDVSSSSKTKLQGSLNGGGPQMRLRSSGGSVTLRAAD